MDIVGDSGDLKRAAVGAAAALEVLRREIGRSTGNYDQMGQSSARAGQSFLSWGRMLKTGLPIALATGGAILALTGNLGALAPVLGLVTSGVGLLLTPLTALAALVVAATGPVSVLAAVLGGVGLGAVLGFQSALASAGPQFHAFRKGIDALKDGFATLTHTLAKAFMPWFMSMLPVAKDILGVFQHLADVAGKGGLNAVFKALTHGAGAQLNKDFLKIVGPIGDVIAKTIAFAFGKGGRMGQSIIAADFHHFTGWVGKAFEPIADWFNRQHFLATGMRWGMEIAQGIGNTLKNMLGGRGLALLLGGAGAGAGIGAALGGPIGALMGAAIGAAIGLVLNHYWPKLVSDAKHALGVVKSALQNALGPQTWSQLVKTAKYFWSALKDIGTILLDIGKIVGGIVKFIIHIGRVTGVWQAIGLAVVSVVKVIANVLLTVIRLVKDVFQWLSNSKNMTAIWHGALGVVKAVVGAISGVLGRAFGVIRSIAHFVGSVLVGAWQGVIGAIQSVIGAIQTAIGWAQSLANAIGGGNTGPGPGYGGARGGVRHPGGGALPHLSRNTAATTTTHVHVYLDSRELPIRNILIRQGVMSGQPVLRGT